MSNKGLSDKSKSILRDVISGQTLAQIAARWGSNEGQIQAIISRLRRGGYLPFATEEEKEAEVERKKQAKNERNRREREDLSHFGKNELSLLENRQASIAQCLNHWRDLDKHHPQGWPSLRLPNESYVSNVRPSMANHYSLSGSPAAMAAEASGR